MFSRFFKNKHTPIPETSSKEDISPKNYGTIKAPTPSNAPSIYSRPSYPSDERSFGEKARDVFSFKNQ